MKMPHMEALSKVFAEFIATALLMFGGCAGCIPWQKEHPDILNALSFGLVVLMLVQSYGAVSGAHFNPAVTLAAYIYKLISLPVSKLNAHIPQRDVILTLLILQMAIGYFFAQMLGALVGYGLLKALTPEKAFSETAGEHGFCATVPIVNDLNPFQLLMLEFIATTFLITLCCSVWDPRNAAQIDSIPLKFGFAVTILSFVFVSISHAVDWR